MELIFRWHHLKKMAIWSKCCIPTKYGVFFFFVSYARLGCFGAVESVQIRVQSCFRWGIKKGFTVNAEYGYCARRDIAWNLMVSRLNSVGGSAPNIASKGTPISSAWGICSSI